MGVKRATRRFGGWLSLKWAAIRYPLEATAAWLISLVGGVAGIAALWDRSLTSQTEKEAIWGWALAVIALISVSAFGIQSFRRAKGRALASTYGQQADASEIIRDTRNFLQQYALLNREGGVVPSDVLPRARAQIQNVLTAYASVFSATTGSRCRLCIKLLRVREDIGDAVPKVEDFYIYALARDALSAKENQHHDEKRRDEYLDKLVDNSDFLRLWSQDIADEGVFFSDDLREEEEYDTSSINYRWNIEQNPNRNRQTDWPLWYVSAIVWPLRQEKNDLLGIQEHVHHGFLTVDSRMRGAFDRGTHEPMGRALANALFPVIDLYTELLSVSDNPRQEEA